MTANMVIIGSESRAVLVTDQAGATVEVTALSPALVQVMQPGVPPGGATDDLLVKASGSDFHTRWTDSPTVDRLGFDLTAGEAVGPGQLAWNADEVTLDLGKGGDVVNQLGQEMMLLCRNGTGATIPDGTAVMFAGTLGASGRIVVAPMVANGTFPGYVFLGVTTHAVSPGVDGFVTVFGKVRGINTDDWNEGDILWCNPSLPGKFTNVEPQAPNLKLPVAAVISKKNNGTIMVRWDTGRRLMDLHDVEANGIKDDLDILHWSQSANRWEPTDRLTLLEQRVTALENA